ncbi:hypothetical protein [Brevirhabdus sp.]|uniref:hypothetical protein n=1 Tax=Brevirhabdus sp. TaxID=2004514 RepID=UPI00405A223A
MSKPYVVVHGGFHKTATSHVQSTLNRNSGYLAKQGVTYVHHRDTRKQYTIPCQLNAYEKLGLDWSPRISDAELREHARAFFDPLVAKGADRIVLSDENMAGHCGHCTKRGVLYRWRRKLIETFATFIPLEVREVHIGVRNYADFFASAYVEYLRSVSGNSFVSEEKMKQQVLENMPSWMNVLKTIQTFFPDATIHVWRHEDFRALEQVVLGNLCGPGVDLAKLKAPKDANKRPTASGRAVEELLRLIYEEGPDAALRQRVELQERYPRGREFAGYDPWTEQERAHLTRFYEKDIADVAADPGLTLITPRGVAVR